MRAADLMTRSVRSCRSDESCAVAARHMWEGDCGCVVVTHDDATVAGIVTDRDLAMAAWIGGKPLAEIPVRTAMASPARAVLASDSLSAVLEALTQEQVHRVPVLDESGVLVGLVSLADVVRVQAKNRVLDAASLVDTIAAICRPRHVELEALPAPEPTVALTPQAKPAEAATTAAAPKPIEVSAGSAKPQSKPDPRNQGKRR